jgi:hypothetical protein
VRRILGNNLTSAIPSKSFPSYLVKNVDFQYLHEVLSLSHSSLHRFSPLDVIGELLTHDGAERGIHDAVMQALLALKMVPDNPNVVWRSGMMMRLEGLSPAEADILKSLEGKARLTSGSSKAGTSGNK